MTDKTPHLEKSAAGAGIIARLSRIMRTLGGDFLRGLNVVGASVKKQTPKRSVPAKGEAILTAMEKKSGAKQNHTAGPKAKPARAARQASPGASLSAPPSENEKYKTRLRSSGTRAALLGSFLGAGVSLAFTGAAAAIFFAFVQVAPRIPEDADLWNVNRQSAIIVLDRNGKEIASRGARYGESVSRAELPDYLTQAFLATEDRRFYEHRGVDFRGMLRAAITNMRSGKVVQGGSTITQQLAKNLFLSSEQTYSRKAREALLAIWLEGRYAKDEIFSLYLNRIYLGAGAYGVESAAQTYFGKSARDITLAEAALIAGLPKAPSTLAPTQNPAGAARRASEVLDNLLETGAITPFAAHEARTSPAPLVNQDADDELGYFFDYVAAKAIKFANESGRRRSGDLVVTTTIDQKLQRDAEAAISAALTIELRHAGAEQAALVAYDNNGALRAMVGGRSYKESQFNRATQAKRQPGSAFKPFVYVAALEAGLTPETRFVDQPVNIDGWAPTNYTPGFSGPVRLTEAMAKSINTVAVQVTEEVGREKVAEAARRLGIRADVPALRSIALGAVDMTLEELTGAYLPFATGGYAPALRAIERIEDRDANLIYQHPDVKPVKVMDAAVAKDMNHLMYQVINGGTGGRASLGARHAMGKTGTTNDWRDAWFVGYTGQLTTGIWVGNDAYRPMDKITGGSVPALIWKDFMLAAHQGQPRIKLAGAYPAVRYASEASLLTFYAEVSRGLRTVRKNGNENRRRRR